MKLLELLSDVQQQYADKFVFTDISAAGEKDEGAVWIYAKNKPRKGNVLIEVWDHRKKKSVVDLVIQNALLNENDTQYVFKSNNNRSWLSVPCESDEVVAYVSEKLAKYAGDTPPIQRGKTMFNQEKLKKIVESYKRDFPTKVWPNEQFKWVAAKHFQENWDMQAQDFGEMFSEATAETSVLLVGRNYFARGMIGEFYKEAPDETRALFENLYDESLPLEERIAQFTEESERIRSTYNTGTWNSHFQRAYPISVYLWLRYPEKYFIYKYTEYKKFAKMLESTYAPKAGDAKSVVDGYAFMEEIAAYLAADEELVDFVKTTLYGKYYNDEVFHTFAFDLAFYYAHYYKESEDNDLDAEWYPKGYDPQLSVEDWENLLADPEVFTVDSLKIMKRMKDNGGQGTCTELSQKYGRTKNFYNSGSSALAKRVAEKTGCPIFNSDNEDLKWWPILYLGRSADKDAPGSFVWKLRGELSEALDEIDMSEIALYENDEPAQGGGHWWLNANPKYWSFSDVDVGKTIEYTLYNDNGHKRRIFQNYLDAKAGDAVICYESTPVKKIVGIGKIVTEQDGEKIEFEKCEVLGTPISYAAICDCPELAQMEFFINPNGSFFKLTDEEYEFLMDLIREANPMARDVPKDTYTKADFLRDVYMEESRYDRLAAVLKNKKNIILQGAPGVGKTFAAKRLAYSLMGEKDDDRVKFIQFHQNYSYEDFVMGYKPSGNGFELQYGIFYDFCKKAESRPDKDFFFIIDEINRGNMSKIFGELLMLIERDYRGTKAVLAYDGIPFAVPENLYLIGMMNTADRSLAMIDYALRRRFSFFPMEPAFDSDGFKAYQEAFADETFDRLIARTVELNREIEADTSLGKGFCIGHSYFCNQTEVSEDWLRGVVEYDILPMLEEYWFDDLDKVNRWKTIFDGVFQ